jgi:23S rRNA G2069 N7-methylase RlmK/C1962 C5-methylase RlmI
MRRELAARTPFYRLFDGAADGLRGLFIDIFDRLIVGHLLEGECPPLDTRLLATSLAPLFDPSAFYLWTHKRRGAPAVELLAGQSLAELELEIDGARLLLKPADQLNAGLFLDARDIRTQARERGRAAKVLNLFCFTGTIGLWSWLGGAAEVVQVDISRSALAWAKRNLELNSGRAASEVEGRMRFIQEDCRDYLPKERRRIERGTAAPYDLVVLDPPSFARSAGTPLKTEKELPDLLEASMAVLRSGGEIVVTTNNRALTGDAIAVLGTEAAHRLGRAVVRSSVVEPPAPDFRSRGKDSISLRGAQLTID